MSVPLLPLLLGALVVEVAGIVVLVSGRRRSAAAGAFVAGSATATAEVTDLRMRWPDNRDVGDGWFCPVVRFALPDGRVVEAETMHGASPAPAKPGDRVAVRYDPADPTRVDLASGRASTGALGCLHTGLGVLLMLAGLVFLAGWFLLAVVVKVPA